MRLKWLTQVCEQCSYPLGPFDATRSAIYPVECPHCGHLNVVTTVGDEEDDPMGPPDSSEHGMNGRITDDQ